MRGEEGVLDGVGEGEWGWWGLTQVFASSVPLLTSLMPW